MRKERKKDPSVRQRKVASYLNRRLSDMVLHNEIEGITGLVTILKVEVSADLRHANVWFSSLNQDPEKVLSVLRSNIYDIQGDLYRDSTMRIMPKVNFRIDHSSQYSDHINQLLAHLNDE